MSNSTPQQSMETRLAESQLRKTEAEIKALEWQNSTKGQIVKHLGTLSLGLTTLATAVAIIISVINYLDSQKKDRELRERELIEKLENSYNTKHESLSGFGQDSSLTSNLAILKLQQIGNLLKNWPQLNETERKKKSQAVTDTLMTLFESGHIDFRKIKDVEFDIGALNAWPEYSELLKQDKSYHPYLIYKYVMALKELHRLEPKPVEEAELKPDGNIATIPFKDEQKGLLFEKLTLGFQKHIKILKESSDPNSYNQLLEAFRSYCEATKNRKLTLDIFGDNRIYGNETQGCN